MTATRRMRREAPDYRFQELLQSVYEGIVITDLQGQIKEVNARAEALFLMDHETLCASDIRQLVSGLNENVLQKVFGTLEDSSHTILEAYCTRADGTVFPGEIAVHKIYLSGDAQLCFSVRNVSARKETEAQLREATEQLLRAGKAKARSDTITTLAHEINNPLQMLLSMAHLDNNIRYLGPLNRIIDVLAKLRHAEELRTVDYAGARHRFEIPESHLVPCTARRILVVDDEPMLRRIFGRVLSQAFADGVVDPAADGREALDRFEAEHHAVIILDIAMPVLNGEETFLRLHEICETNQWEMPAVIFCTGFLPPDSVLQAVRQHAMHAYLPKPVSHETLLHVVRERLDAYDMSHGHPGAGRGTEPSSDATPAAAEPSP